MKLSHDSAFPLAMCASDASSCSIAEFELRLKTEMEKAVFQVTVSLNLRKDSIADTLPPPRGNGEGSSNKQLELPVNIQVLDSLFFDSQCR